MQKISRQYVYIHWYDTGEIIEAGTVAAAKAMVRDRYPSAHFDDWEDAPRSIHMPVWASSAKRLRYELGETQDENKPVAYVFMQDWRIAERRVSVDSGK